MKGEAHSWEASLKMRQLPIPDSLLPLAPSPDLGSDSIARLSCSSTAEPVTQYILIQRTCLKSETSAKNTRGGRIAHDAPTRLGTCGLLTSVPEVFAAQVS